MANIYVTDETKENLETVAELEDRTQNGEINFLCKQRIKDISAPSAEKTSVKNDPNSIKFKGDCQAFSGVSAEKDTDLQPADIGENRSGTAAVPRRQPAEPVLSACGSGL